MTESTLQTTLTLNNGKKMPMLGLGTWQSREGDECYRAVRRALEIGYRHIDTAAIYGNEKSVGKAINDSEVEREDIFLTTKVWNDDHGHDATLNAFEESVNRLNVGYIDLYLVHWPTPKRTEAYRALQELYEQERVRSIGVSNFLVKHLEDLQEKTDVIPAVNQFELSPFNYGQRKDLIDYCKHNSIAVEAYSPLTRGKKFSDELIQELAEKYSKSPAQILIRWGLEHGFISIPKSTSPDHIRQNADVFDFFIESDDIDRLDNKNEDLCVVMRPEKFD